VKVGHATLLFVPLGLALLTFACTLAAFLPRDIRPEYAYAYPAVISSLVFLAALLLLTGIADMFGYITVKREPRVRDFAKNLAFAAVIVMALLASTSALRFALGTPTPLLAVTSKSMAPTLNVGDLLVVRGTSSVEVGDIVAFRRGSDIVVHRVYNVTENGIITKGDAYSQPDPWIIQRDEILGKVVFSIPLLGYVHMALSNPLVLAVIVIFAASVPALARSVSVVKPEPTKCPFLKRKCRFGGFNPKVCSVCLQAKQLKANNRQTNAS